MVVSVLIALIVSLFLRAYGLWTWSKVGLLAALLALRAGVTATVEEGSSANRAPRRRSAGAWVPMLLTIGFLVLAARAGRRAVRGRSGRSPVTMAAVAAAGAGSSVAALSALVASLVTLRFPTFGVTIGVDPGSAALGVGTHGGGAEW